MTRTVTAERQPALFADPQPKSPGKKKTRTATKSTAVAVHKPQATAPSPTSVGELIGWLATASSRKNVDIAKMREIRDLIREIQKDEESKAYNAAMLACQTEIDPVVIQKDGRNKDNNTMWARLETISRAIDPIIRRHGFTLSYSMGMPRKPEHYLIVCDVSHSGGHVRRYEADIGEDSKGPKGGGTKSLAQGSGSSAHYGRRYLKVMIFDIKIEGENHSDKISVSLITAEQVGNLKQVIKFKDATEKQVCDYAGKLAQCDVSKLEDIPARVHDRVLAGLQNYSPEKNK